MKNNDTSTFQLTCLQNSLLISIFETPEKYLSNVERKHDMRRLRTSSVNSSPQLFFCFIRAMYNRVNFSKKTYIMLKSYLPVTNTSIFLKRHYGWIEKYPYVMQLHDVSDSLFVKIYGTLVKKHKHLPQISVLELHNDMILPDYLGVFW